MNKFSTLKIADSDTSPVRVGRCDDDGYQQVKIINGSDTLPTPIAISQATPGVTNNVAIDQSTPGTTDSVSVKSGSVKSSANNTRPNDILPYLAGDILGTSTSSSAVLTFPLVGPANKVIRITGSRLEVNVTSIPSGMTSFRLHLYSSTPPSSSTFFDNVPWDLPSGDRSSYLGYVDLGNPIDLGSTLYVQQTGLDYDFEMGSTTSLFGYLTTTAPFTPTASTIKVVTLYSLGM
jgi:hypothetical protein